MAGVTLIDDYGLPQVVDEAQVPQALQQGWHVQTPEEAQAADEALRYGTLGGMAETGVENALSGATLGLSDVALGELGGDEYRAAREARARVNPTTALAGTVAGAIAPALVTEGGSLAETLPGMAVRGVGAPTRAAMALGRAGEGIAGAGLRGLGMTGESVLGRGIIRGAELGAGGAIEGGLFGAGQALSEAALAPGGNYDHLAEKMFAGGTEGAKFGLLTGGGLGFLGGASSRAIERGAEKLVGPGGLKNLLERQGEGATIRALGSMTPGDAAKLGESGITRMAREVRDATLDDGQKVFTAGASKEQIGERVAKAVEETGGKVGAIRRDVSDAIEASGRHDLRPELGGFFRDVDAMVAEAETGPRSLAKRAAKAAREVEPLRASYEAGTATLEDVVSYRRKLDAILYPPNKAGGIQVAAKNAAELSAIRGKLEAAIEGSMDRAVGELMPARAGEYQALKTRLGALKDAEKLAGREASRELTRNRFSPFETLSALGGGIAGVATGHALPVIAGAGLGLARKLWRSRGESVLAVLADRAARSDNTISAAIKRFSQKASNVRRGIQGEAGAREVEQKGRIERVLRPRSGESYAAAYRRRLQQLSDFTPDKMTGFNDLAGAAPQTAASAAAVLTRGRAYLLAKAPTERLSDDPLQPHLNPPKPNPQLLEVWARRLEAVQDPGGVLKRGLENGNLTREHVEAIKTVYPEIYADTRSKLEDQLLTMKQRLPYEQRVRLGVLFQLPTDKALRPDQLARTQAMYAAQQEAPPQVAPPSQAQAQNTMASQYQSESQRLEQGTPPQ